jgi:hypothetical protein
MNLLQRLQKTVSGYRGFPITVYPVLYKSYWLDTFGDKYRVKVNQTSIQLQAITQVFKNYYNINFNPSTLTAFTYDDQHGPYTVVFVINYLYKGQVHYIWEYLDNWAKLKQLNQHN